MGSQGRYLYQDFYGHKEVQTKVLCVAEGKEKGHCRAADSNDYLP